MFAAFAEFTPWWFPVGRKIMCAQPSSPDTLSRDALNWAMTHIERYGDTDIFPVPFEFKAARAAWTGLLPELETLDFGKHKVGASRRILVPKPAGDFRVATQLDPLDALIYTACIYEVAKPIEAYRIPASKNAVCSYRVDIDANGRLFESGNGWSTYHSRSVSLANSGSFSHVLLADISDFYNQVSQHRVQSALEDAGISPERATNVERFLSDLAAKHSRGLPVGPTPSILLAEASLDDVDDFLLRRGAIYVRYVDDFRIFCSSRREAIGLKHDLTEFLYTAHRLSLQPSKSRIYRRQRFVEAELLDPESEERRAQRAKLEEILEDIREQTGYVYTPEEIPAGDEIVSRAARESLTALLKECIEKKPLNLGVARRLLKRATILRTAALNETLFQNLETLAPVFRDVALYIVKSVPRKTALKRGRELVEFLHKGNLGGLPFIRLWILEIVARRPDMLEQQQASALAEQSATGTLGLRTMALLARSYKLVEWVRAQTS